MFQEILRSFFFEAQRKTNPKRKPFYTFRYRCTGQAFIIFVDVQDDTTARNIEIWLVSFHSQQEFNSKLLILQIASHAKFLSSVGDFHG